MRKYSDTAIDIINDLHTERLDYKSEYLPLIDAVNMLAEYEDAEEQGLLVRLPCKVGDMVYLSDGRKATATSFYHAENISQGNCWLTVKCNGRKNNENRLRLSVSEFGKTVFLTKEEAEQALNKKFRRKRQ